MGYYGFLTTISRLENSEFELDEQFEEIINNHNESLEYVNKASQWIIEELKYLIEIKQESLINLFIHNTDIELILSYSPSVNVNSLEDVLALVKNENWIKDKDGIDYLDEESSIIVYKALEMIKNQRFESLCTNKLNLLKFDLTLLKEKLFFIIKTIQNENEKDVFIQFLDYLKEFQADSKGVSQVEGSNLFESFPKTVDWHPFHCDDLRDFYLYLESKYDTSETKSIFSAFWKFFEKEYLIDVMDKRIKQRYITWVNERFNFQGEQMIKNLQTNTESFDLQNFQKHLTIFENSKGLDFSFHDFRDGAIQGTKKRKNSK
jgi:hypothetical protein